MNPVRYTPPTLPEPSSTLELSTQVLAIAQGEQTKELLVDQELAIFNKKSVKSSSQLITLDPPKTSASMAGSFSQTMITAMSNLAGLLGDMADSTRSELQFKQIQAKNLLQEKLANIKDREEQRLENAKIAEEQAEQVKKGSIFSTVANFLFAAAEIIGGVFMVAGGILSGQPTLIAGGTLLMAAGAMELAAEVMSLTGGSEATQDKLRNAALGCMVAGLVISSYGAYSIAAKGVAKSKDAVIEGGETLVEGTLKNTTKKMSKEIAESAAENMDPRLLKNLLNVSFKEFANYNINTMTKNVVKSAEVYFSKFIEAVAKEAADNGVEMASEKIVKEAMEEAVDVAKKAIVKNTDELMTHVRGLRYFMKGAAVMGMVKGSQQIYVASKQNEFDKRQVQLNHEIEKLKAELVEIQANQELINKLIQLIQETWARAAVGPIEEAMKVIASTIQDHGAVSRRLAASV